MTSDKGLLKRAAAIRTLQRVASSSGLGASGGMNVAGTPGSAGASDREAESGITTEERREISAAIDVVSRANRIASGGAPLEVTARKRGILLPLVVNAAAILVTVAVLFFLARGFVARDTAIIAQGSGLASAEGKLLQELKRESDARLRERDRAIADIQVKMQTVDKERNDLVATMDERVTAREAQLRTQLQDELNKERASLEGQGLSAAGVQSRLKAFADQKNQELQRELAAFKAQAAADRAAADLTYKKLGDEYARNMSALGAERKKILDDAQAQEDKLRATVDEKTRQLEAQGASARAALDRAKAELARLQSGHDAAQAAEDRIVGFYSTIKQAFQDRRFDAAASAADDLSAYLDDPAVATLPTLQARRPMDLFVAETLAGEARTELQNAVADTSQLLDQARLLGEVEDAARAADAAQKAGDRATADAKYQEALSKVPEILAAYQWFVGEAAAAEAARRDQVARDAAAAVAADTLASRPSLDAGATALAAGRWKEAIDDYLAVLTNWPKAEGAAEAVGGIRAADRGLSGALADLAASSAKSQVGADAKARGLADSLAAAASDNVDLSRQNADLSARIASLESRARAMAEENARLADQLRHVPKAATVAASSLDIVALQKQVDDLRNLDSRWIGVTQAYGGFIAASTAAKGDTAAELASLKTFLSDERVRGTFGDLGSTIDRVLATWNDQTATDAVHNAAFIAVQAAGMADSGARDRYLAGQATVFASDSLVSAFIVALRSAW